MRNSWSGPAAGTSSPATFPPKASSCSGTERLPSDLQASPGKEHYKHLSLELLGPPPVPRAKHVMNKAQISLCSALRWVLGPVTEMIH